MESPAAQSPIADRGEAPVDRATAPGRDGRFAMGVALAFAVLAGFATFHHEMWRDELQAWLLARDSATPGALLANIRYEGHPLLWFALLWPLARAGLHAWAMQALNVLLGTATAWLVARHAPAPRWVRAAAALGYFPLYEYGTIARNYELGLLGLVACCAVFPARRTRPVLLGVLLALTAMTSLPACLLVIAALVALGLEAIVDRPAPGAAAAAWGGLGIAAAGVALAAAQMNPPPDSGFATGWLLELHPEAIGQVLATVPRAYLPLLQPGSSFWQSDALAAIPGWAAWAWLPGLGLVAVACAGLLRRPVALVFYGAATLGTLVFFYVKALGYLRHWGFLFVALGAALWMARSLPAARLPAARSRVAAAAERALPILFAVLVVAHLAASAVAVAGEYRYVFSGARALAATLRARGLERLPIVADRDIRTVAVVGYLDVDRVLYAHGSRSASYVTWDRGRFARANVWSLAASQAAARGGPVLVLLDSEAMAQREPPAALGPYLRTVGCAAGEIVPDETFCAVVVDPAAR